MVTRRYTGRKMKNIIIKLFYIIIASLILQDKIFGGVCICDSLTRSDSTRYYVGGLMDHSELKPEWILEEINKKDINVWFREYSIKLYSEYFIISDSTEFNKAVDKSTEFHINKWKEIKPLIRDEDKIYYYTTPDIYWKSLAGQEGIVIIKNCEILFVYILSQS